VDEEAMMPEGNINAEVAEHLREQAEHETTQGPSKRRIETIEILEAVLLSVVALVTALSGYQAARWDGESAKAYATSSRLRAESNELQVTSDQQLIYNSGTLTAWIQSVTSGDSVAANVLRQRFTPEYQVAFDAWLQLHPLTNREAPAGPRFMPQFKDPLGDKAVVLGRKATATFNDGVEFRSRAEHYVRVTVVLAAVLVLIALGMRFKIRGVRYAVNAVAGLFLVYCVVLVITYPHV
jgi:hypothetical protein